MAKISEGTIIDDGHGLILEGRYLIQVDQPLSDLSRPDAQACAVKDKQDPDADLFALLTPPDTFVRHDMLAVLQEKPLKRMRGPKASGILRLKNGKHVGAIVFDHRSARPILQVTPKVREADLMSTIIPGLVPAMIELQQRGLVHRSIRPETILLTLGGDILLDQCLVGLPGMYQPPAFEPIGIQLAQQTGRGDGLSGDDVFAFAVTVFQLLTGEQPAKGIKPNDLYAQRVLRGSYDVLLKRRKFATAIQVMFAGSLRDEDDRRWTHDDLNRWMNGIFDMPRPSGGGRRATRPFIFRDGEYFAPQLLAQAMQKNPEDAATLILNGRLEKWLRNVLVDETGADIIRRGLELVIQPKSATREEKADLVCRSILALDPGGPIRYRSVNCTASGLAGGLWHAFISNEQGWCDDFARLLGSSLLDEWLRVGGRAVRAGLPANILTRIRSVAKESSRVGFGIERVLYELLQRQPCLGAEVMSEMPRTPGELMAALDRKHSDDADADFGLAIHSAAFLAAHDRRLERSLRSIPGGDKGIDGLIRAARFMAELQEMHHRTPVPGITRAFAKALGPVTKSLQSRVRRMVVEKKVESFVKRGDLSALLAELDMLKTLDQDRIEFENAVAQYNHLEHVIAQLSEFGPRQRALAMHRGYRYAQMFSLSVSFLTVFYFSMEAIL
ncbi:MAG: hypothetical protein P1U37_08030 [Minwuia sp.]|nr:hypothetical protein [Minwuia sp.]